MRAKFVTIIGNAMVADYTMFNKHFKYLSLTPEEEQAVIAEAEKWAVLCEIETDVSYDEFGDYSLDTKKDITRLTDSYGDVIVRDGKIWGVVVNNHGIVKKGGKLVDKWDDWESRAVYYYTHTYSLIRVDKE